MMYIKNRVISVVFKAAVLICALTGILIQIGVFDGKFRSGCFHYFTTLSNIAVIIFLIYAIIETIKDKMPKAGLRGGVLMAISLTMLVAAFILPPSNAHGIDGFFMTLLHVVAPAGFILDWLLFDKKGRWRLFYPPLWMAAPYAYCVYALVVGGLGLMGYPYFFLDVNSFGGARVSLNILLISVAYIVGCYLLVLADRILARAEKKKAIYK